MTGAERQRRARVFALLTEAKHSLEALEERLQRPADKARAAELAGLVKAFRAELQARLEARKTLQQPAANRGQGA